MANPTVTDDEIDAFLKTPAKGVSDAEIDDFLKGTQPTVDPVESGKKYLQGVARGEIAAPASVDERLKSSGDYYKTSALGRGGKAVGSALFGNEATPEYLANESEFEKGVRAGIPIVGPLAANIGHGIADLGLAAYQGVGNVKDQIADVYQQDLQKEIAPLKAHDPDYQPTLTDKLGAIGEGDAVPRGLSAAGAGLAIGAYNTVKPFAMGAIKTGTAIGGDILRATGRGDRAASEEAAQDQQIADFEKRYEQPVISDATSIGNLPSITNSVANVVPLVAPVGVGLEAAPIANAVGRGTESLINGTGNAIANANIAPAARTIGGVILDHTPGVGAIRKIGRAATAISDAIAPADASAGVALKSKLPTPNPRGLSIAENTPNRFYNLGDLPADARNAGQIASTLTGAAVPVGIGAAFGASTAQPGDAEEGIRQGAAFGALASPLTAINAGFSRQGLEQAARTGEFIEAGQRPYGDKVLDAQHDEAMANLSPEDQAQVNAARGLYRGLSDNGKPVRIIVQDREPFMKGVEEVNGGQLPAGNIPAGYYNHDTATVHLNSDSAIGDIGVTLAHALGHEATHPLSSVVSGINPEQARTLQASTARAAVNPDGSIKPEFQRFIDAYNGGKSVDWNSLPDTSETGLSKNYYFHELGAQTGAALDAIRNPGKYALPPEASDLVFNALGDYARSKGIIEGPDVSLGLPVSTAPIPADASLYANSREAFRTIAQTPRSPVDAYSRSRQNPSATPLYDPADFRRQPLSIGPRPSSGTPADAPLEASQPIGTAPSPLSGNVVRPATTQTNSTEPAQRQSATGESISSPKDAANPSVNQSISEFIAFERANGRNPSALQISRKFGVKYTDAVAAMSNPANPDPTRATQAYRDAMALATLPKSMGGLGMKAEDVAPRLDAAASNPDVPNTAGDYLFHMQTGRVRDSRVSQAFPNQNTQSGQDARSAPPSQPVLPQQSVSSDGIPRTPALSSNAVSEQSRTPASPSASPAVLGTSAETPASPYTDQGFQRPFQPDENAPAAVGESPQVGQTQASSQPLNSTQPVAGQVAQALAVDSTSAAERAASLNAPEAKPTGRTQQNSSQIQVASSVNPSVDSPLAPTTPVGDNTPSSSVLSPQPERNSQAGTGPTTQQQPSNSSPQASVAVEEPQVQTGRNPSGLTADDVARIKQEAANSFTYTGSKPSKKTLAENPNALEERVNAARRENEINALFSAHEPFVQDGESVQLRIDPDTGKPSIKGRAFNEDDPVHQEILSHLDDDTRKSVDAVQSAIADGKPLNFDYMSAATKGTGTTGTGRKAAQKASTATARAEGDGAVEESDKLHYPLSMSVTGQGAVTSFGFSPDKVIGNAQRLLTYFSDRGDNTVPYRNVNNPEFIKDYRGYAENQANGWKGDGSAPLQSAGGIEIQANPDYQPHTLTPEKSQFMNLVTQGDQALAKTGTQKGENIRQFAKANGLTPDAATNEVNALRAQIDARNDLQAVTNKGQVTGTGKVLESPFETIRTDLISNLKPVTDEPATTSNIRAQAFRGDRRALTEGGLPSGKVAAAGFLPAKEAGAVTPEQVTDAAKQWEEKGVNSPYFKNWSEGLPVIKSWQSIPDKGGFVVRAYHGTNDSFNAFDPKKSGGVHYFSEAPEYAEDFGENVMDSYVKSNNPLRAPDESNQFDASSLEAELTSMGVKLDASTKKQIQGAMEDGDSAPFWVWMRRLSEPLSKTIKASGYDSVLQTEGGENAIIALHSSQIKSATNNRGTFDKTNPNINFLPSKPQDLGEFNPSELGRRIATGTESTIYLSKDGKSVMRYTRPNDDGLYGRTPSVVDGKIKEAPSSQEDFIQRLNLANQVFGENTRVQGVASSGGKQLIASSQPYYGDFRTDASYPEIKDYMQGLGFEQKGNGWYRSSDNVYASDVAEGNFKKTPDGIQAIDVPVVKAMPEMQKILGVRQGQFLPAQSAGAVTPEQITDAAKQWKEKGTDSPYFKEWFGKSSVVDDNGNPLLVKHGTSGPKFEEFKPKLNNKEQIGFGVSFTPDAAFAESYAHDPLVRRKNGEGRVVDAYLSIKNSLNLDQLVREGQPEFELAKRIAGKKLFSIKDENGVPSVWLKNAIDEAPPAKALQSLLDAGYDGVEYTAEKFSRGVGTKENLTKAKTFVAFHPEQIKSVENRGTFDARDSRINFLPNSDSQPIADNPAPYVYNPIRSVIPPQRRRDE